MNKKVLVFTPTSQTVYALVNFMPHPRGGWGNTGDLTNHSAYFMYATSNKPAL